MVIEETVMTKTVVVSKLICDICKKEYSLDRESDDTFQVQEFIHINLNGGYGSIFGDGSSIKCDICQHCLKEKLGEFLRIEEHY